MALYDHILLPDQVRSASIYSPRSAGGGERNIPERNREGHAQHLQAQFDVVRSQGDSIRQEMDALALPASHGLYVEFSGAPAYDLLYGSLESKDGIRLLNVREVINDQNVQTVATVFIPHGEERKFLNKLQKYATEISAISGKPKNDTLIRSIENICSAQLYSLWTDDPNKFPTQIDDWFEVWIRTKNVENDIIHTEFINALTALDITYKPNSILEFPERSVFLVKANKNSFVKLLKACDLLAEIRSVSPLASFFTGQRSFESQEWIDELIDRTDFNNDSNSVVSVIDTGVNNGHPLLENIIPDANCDTVVVDDVADRAGHGTRMCGVVAYGNLSKCLETKQRISIDKHITSVKILGRVSNDKDNWGELTKQAEYKTKIIYPEKQVCYCLAVTTDDEECKDGKPSSWSGAIDSISAENNSLFLISAGNLRDINGRDKDIVNAYPENNRLKLILNPAQAWNSLTIGAYTDLVAANNRELDGFRRVAPSGGLSPFSRTSGLWKKESLIKPEVMFEGGNLKVTNDADLPFDIHDDLSILTLNSKFNISGHFDTINATSCATALAADFAGRLQSKYPHLWAESIRGLMVHSAQWTDEMKRQFPADNKTELAQRLRNCGYGVPSERRAFHSTENGFTFIAQEQIQPYIKKHNPKGGYSYNINEMHLFKLPWPTDVLRELDATLVTLKVTLSYFVEPAPGEIGWKDKYRYASHGLRFDLNKSDEDKRAFELRINKAMEAEEGEERGKGGDSHRWLIGSDNRDKGSIHSDEITLSAIQLIDCNLIAIYPIGGWWKTRTNLNRYNSRTRYSLIVSLDTPAENVDLYNVVKTKIETLIAIPIEVEIPIG